MYNPQITVERITILRNEKNISLVSLNEACNLNKNTIKMSETSKNGLSAAFLFDISNYLDCSTDYLLGRTDNPNITNSISNTNTTVNGTQANVINNNQEPITEPTDEMTRELIKAFRTLPFKDKMDIMNAVMKKSEQ